jgi:hypothetical protein
LLSLKSYYSRKPSFETATDGGKEKGVGGYIVTRYLCAAAWKKSFAVREGQAGCNAIFLVMPLIRGRKVCNLQGYSLITALTALKAAVLADCLLTPSPATGNYFRL